MKDEKELQEKLNEIREGLSVWDSMPHSEYDFKDKVEKYYINDAQYKTIQKMLDFLSSLGWQLALNSYKQLIRGQNKVLVEQDFLGHKCGMAVKIRPCADEYKDKTYFGIFIGDVAQGISSSIDKEGNLKINMGYHNPAILVPELNKIIYGCESWWGIIKDETELDNLITDETIRNVWYVKLLKDMEK